MGIAVLAAAGADVAATAPQAVRIMLVTINSVKIIHSFDFG
jgi:hypothetical protein